MFRLFPLTLHFHHSPVYHLVFISFPSFIVSLLSSRRPSPHTSSPPPGTPAQRARHLPVELVSGWPPLHHHTSSLDRLLPAARRLDPRSRELQAVRLHLLHQHLRQHCFSLLYITRQVPGCGIPSALRQGSTNQNRYVGLRMGWRLVSWWHVKANCT